MAHDTKTIIIDSEKLNPSTSSLSADHSTGTTHEIIDKPAERAYGTPLPTQKETL